MLLRPGERMGGLWGWTYEGDDRPHAIVRYEADFPEPDYPWLRLRYNVSGERVDCMVRLVTTRPNYGGAGGGSSARSWGAAPRSSICRRAAGSSGAARPTG